MFNLRNVRDENPKCGGTLPRSERKNTQKQSKELIHGLVKNYFPTPVKEAVLDFLKNEKDSSVSCEQDFQRPVVKEATKLVLTSFYEVKNKVSNWF